MRWHRHLVLLVLAVACSAHETEYKVPAFAQFRCPEGTRPDMRNVGGEIFRRCIDGGGILEGPFVSWDRRTRVISMKGTYRHGKLSGLTTTYHSNGKKMSESTYVDGVQDGESRIWDEHGNLKIIQTYDAKLGGKLVDEKDFPAPGRDP